MKLPPRLWKLLHAPAFKRLLIASPFLALISLLLFYAIINTWGTHKLNQTRANLQQRGYALTFEELIQPPPSSGIDPEAYIDASTIVSLLRASGHTRFNYPVRKNSHGNPETGQPPDKSRTSEHTAGIAAEIDNFASAIRFGNTLCPPDRINRWSKIPPYESPIWNDAPHLHEQARWSARNGDVDTAIDYLETSLHFLGLHANRAPTLLTDLKAVELQSTHTRAIWDLACCASFNDADLSQFAAHLKTFDESRLLIRIFETELAICCDGPRQVPGMFTTIPTEEFYWSFDWHDPKNWLSSLAENCWQLKPVGFIHSDLADALDMLDKEFLHLPDGSPRTAWTLEEAQNLQRRAANAKIVKTTIRDDYPLDEQILVHYADHIAAFVTHQTEIRLATIAIAIERHRRATGNLPQSLADLTPTYLPTLPVNLLSDQPFHIRPAPSSPRQMQIIAPGPTPDSDLIWHSPHPPPANP